MTLRRYHDAIESAFEAWGRQVVRWRWFVAVGTLAMTTALALQIPGLRSDNSAESFLLPDDPARIEYDRFREQFGQDDQIVVLIRPAQVFEPAFLERLREFHRALEDELPYVEDVTSLVNVRNTRGDGDTLIVEELLENWPESESDLVALKRRVLGTPLYLNNLVDPQAEVTTVLIKPFTYSTLDGESDALAGFEDASAEDAHASFLSDEEASELVSELLAVTERFEAPGFELHLAGGYIGNQHSTQMMMRDVRLFMSLSIAVMALVLYTLFRRLSAVVLPLFVVLLSLASTLGIQALIDVPASVSGQIVPPLLMAVGVCGAVHLLTLVYRELAAGRARGEAIASALGHSGLAVAMASLTTAVGLLSFQAAALAQVRNLGIVAPIGVMMALLYVVVLLPALLAIVPLRTTGSSGDALQRRLSGWLTRVGGASTRHPWRVLAGTAVVLALGALGASRLQFSQFPLHWFPPDDPVRLAAELTDRELGGASTLEVLVDTREVNGLQDPALLRRLERAVAFAESYDDGAITVAKAISILDVVKETHQALNANDTRYYAIPEERPLLAQELLLFENSGSDDLGDVTTHGLPLPGRSAHACGCPWVDAICCMPEFIAGAGDSGLREDPGTRRSASRRPGWGSCSPRRFVVRHQRDHGPLVRARISPSSRPLLVLLDREPAAQGLVAMIPNLIPVFLDAGLDGLRATYPLDGSTLMLGCIIIGLAVDDTIHFMHKFQRYYGEVGDVAIAVHRTLETTGSALLFTSIVLGCGFSVMMLGYMDNVADFARLATFATVVAFLADVVLAPALLVLVTGEKALPARR